MPTNFDPEPTPGTLLGTWGGPLNTLLSQIVGAVNAVEIAAGVGITDFATATAAARDTPGIAGFSQLVVAPPPDTEGLRVQGALGDVGIIDLVLVQDGAEIPIAYTKNAGAALGATDHVFTIRDLLSDPNNHFDIYGFRHQNGVGEFAYPGPPGNMLTYRNALHETFDADRGGHKGDWQVALGSAGQTTVINRFALGEYAAPVPTYNYLQVEAHTTSMTATVGSGFLGAPVTAGDTYSTVAYVRSVVTSRSPQVGIQWFDGSSVFISETLGSAGSETSGAWTKLTSGTLTAPVGAVYGSICVKWPTTVATEKHRISGCAMYHSSETLFAPPFVAQPWPTWGEARPGDRWWQSDSPSTSAKRLHICTTGGVPQVQVWVPIAALSSAVALALGSAGAGSTGLYSDAGHVHPTTGLAVLSTYDAKGDLVAGTANDTAARFAVGSNGQVLTAQSGQTAGLLWATLAASDVGAVASSLVDAKGDLLAGAANDTIARLAVGSSKQTLKPDTGQTTGLAWTDVADVQTFVATGTWNRPSWATIVHYEVIGQGGGGGSGRRGAAGGNRFPGGGGGGGARTEGWCLAADLSSSETVTVGTAGGQGGASRTSDNTDGAAGTNGSASSFKSTSFAFAGGGDGGGAGTATTANGAFGGAGEFSGGGGAGGAATAGSAPGASNHAPAGGGSGGGLDTGNTIRAGGAGGQVLSVLGLAGGTAGTSAGGSGGAGTSATAGQPVPGTGGGGGGSGTGAGGTGGAGGVYGGGGGGGAASVNGQASGAGGAGGAGIVRITSF